MIWSQEPLSRYVEEEEEEFKSHCYPLIKTTFAETFINSSISVLLLIFVIYQILYIRYVNIMEKRMNWADNGFLKKTKV
jgi:hypothetical protein